MPGGLGAPGREGAARGNAFDAIDVAADFLRLSRPGDTLRLLAAQPEQLQAIARAIDRGAGVQHAADAPPKVFILVQEAVQRVRGELPAQGLDAGHGRDGVQFLRAN